MIRVRVVGDVSESFIEKIKAVVEEFHAKIGWEPTLLEINVYSTASRMRTYILREAGELGVAVVGEFPIMHEAWRGWPRIHVSYEECSNLDERVFKALLLHELAHSVLHGSPYHYMVGLNAKLIRDYGREAFVVAYLASVVVKDFEVFKLLKNLGYENEIALYIEYVKPQLESVKCNDIVGLLELAKLLTPHALCDREVGNLDSSCTRIAGRVVEVIRKLDEVNGDLEDKIVFLANMLREVLETSKGYVGGFGGGS